MHRLRNSLIMLLAVAALQALGADGEPDLWFRVGEVLVYRVYWGVIPVAITQVSSHWIEEDGRKLLALRYTTKTNRFVEKLYPVNDYIETIVEPESFLPVRFVKKMSRRRALLVENTTFDYEKLEAHWESKLTGKEKTFPIAPTSRELGSFMYHMRSQPFVPGEESTYRVVADGKIWDVSIRTLGLEEIELPNYGKVPSLRVEADAKFKGIFDLKGVPTLWVSDDERRVCTKITGKVAFAHIHAYLCHVRGPKEDRWTGLPEADCADDPPRGTKSAR